MTPEAKPYEPRDCEEWFKTTGGDRDWALRWRPGTPGMLVAQPIDNTERRAAEGTDRESARVQLYRRLEQKTGYRLGDLVKPEVGPYEYFPLIHRPSRDGDLQEQYFPRERIASHVTISRLLEALRAVFAVVEPSDKNRTAYGHAIRQLLILACTDVEDAWKLTMRANGYNCERSTTADYIKLRDPMRLTERSLRLSACPDWPEIWPFRGWTVPRTSESLPWFDAYNAVKHDKTRSLDRAQLGNAVDAVAGVVIMHFAQFGSDDPLFAHEPLVTRFELNALPNWAPEESYYGFVDDNQAEPEWQPRQRFGAGQ